MVWFVGFHHHHERMTQDHKHRCVAYLHPGKFRPEISRIYSVMCVIVKENFGEKDLMKELIVLLRKKIDQAETY